MLRRVLTYQLILAVAVGPLLCCCSAGKLLAKSSSACTTSASSQSEGTAERASHSCCSHQHPPAKSDHGHKPAPAKSDPSKPGHPTDKCPCKDGSGEPQATPADAAQTGVSTFLRALTLDPIAQFVPSTIAETVALCVEGRDCRQCPSHHSLTTADLLYAHHNIRC